MEVKTRSHKITNSQSSIDAKEQNLISHGYVVSDRSPLVKPEHAGRYMVTDPNDDEDGFCIVGDDRNELINEAHRHLFDESGFTMGDSHVLIQHSEYYLQDSRSYVGNDVLFWAKDGKGYTTDISKAQVFSQENALSQHRIRPTDIPWPKAYLDAKTRPVVDMQYINKNEALLGTGIILSKPEKVNPERYKCCGCGVFMSAASYYSGKCKMCDADNRP